MRKIDIYEVTLSLAKKYAEWYNDGCREDRIRRECYWHALRQVINHEELHEFERQLNSKSNSLEPYERAQKFVKELFKTQSTTI